MSELNAALGSAKHHIRFTDKAGVARCYPVSLVTQAAKAAYAVALFERARDSLGRVKAIADKDYYERKLDALTDAYLNGDFALEAELGRKALTRPGGSVLLLSILMGAADAPLPEAEVINVVAQAPDETAAVFKAVMRESFPAADFEAAEAAVAGGPPAPKA